MKVVVVYPEIRVHNPHCRDIQRDIRSRFNCEFGEVVDVGDTDPAEFVAGLLNDSFGWTPGSTYYETEPAPWRASAVTVLPCVATPL